MTGRGQKGVAHLTRWYSGVQKVAAVGQRDWYTASLLIDKAIQSINRFSESVGVRM
jgi:hypothetical protein